LNTCSGELLMVRDSIQMEIAIVVCADAGGAFAPAVNNHSAALAQAGWYFFDQTTEFAIARIVVGKFWKGSHQWGGCRRVTRQRVEGVDLSGGVPDRARSATNFIRLTDSERTDSFRGGRNVIVCL
jgi:hypothetical protein